MPTIEKYPNTRLVNTLNCLTICLKGGEDEFVLNQGSKASFEIQIENDFTAPANGETFTLAGVTFTFNNPVPNNYNSKEILSTDKGSELKEWLIGAIGLNYNFEGVTITENPTGFRLEFCDFGFRENYNFELPVFMQVQSSNGESFNINDNKRLLWQLFCKTLDGEKDIPISTPSNPMVHRKEGIIISNCFDVKSDISIHVKTRIPTLDLIPSNDDTIKKEFYLKYGTVEYIQSSEECKAEFGDWITADTFSVINALYQPDDPNAFSDYVFPLQKKFLTNIPSGFTINCDTYRWLWLCVPSDQLNLFVTLKTFDSEGNNIITDDISVSSLDGNNVIILPVGTSNINLLYPPINFTDVQSYSLEIKSIESGSPPIINSLSEEYLIRIDKRIKCCDVEVYYKTDAGGYDTISFDYIKSIDYEVEQTEICLDTMCGGVYTDRLINNGRSMVNAKAKEKITLTTSVYQKNRTHREIFKQFKKSNIRLIRVKDLSLNDVLRTFLIEPNGIKIFEKGEKLKMDVVGYFEESLSTNEI